MKKLILLAVVFAGSLGNTLAQRQLVGTVTNTSGQALTGVAVNVQGTSFGTRTDSDGKYTLDVWRNATAVVFRHANYDTLTLAIGKARRLNAQLQLRAATGLGTANVLAADSVFYRRASVAIDVLSADDLQHTPYPRLDELLQARLPSLQVLLATAQAGTGSQLRHRGPFSVQTTTTPLLIIDGIRVDQMNGMAALGLDAIPTGLSALADIPIESIAQVAFIPATLAGTQYGSQAAGGALVITTHKGDPAAQSRFNYQASVGMMQGETRFLHFPETADLIYQTGRAQLHRLSWQASTERVTFNFSGSFYQDEGTNVADAQERINFRLGMRAAISPKLTYAASAAYLHGRYAWGYHGNTSLAPLSLAEGGYWGDLATASATHLDSLQKQIVQQQSLADLSARVHRFQSAQQLHWKPVESLQVKLRLGIDYNQQQQRSYFSNTLGEALGVYEAGTVGQGQLDLADRQAQVWSSELRIGHRVVSGDFAFQTSLGGQYYRQFEEQDHLRSLGLRDNAVSANDASAQNANEFRLDHRYGGLFLSEQIAYRDQLFADAAIRWEGHNAFGGQQEATPIYRLGLSYALPSTKATTEGPPASLLSDFRLRAALGQALNYPVLYNQLAGASARALLSERPLSYSQPDSLLLLPEKMTNYEVGFSTRLFKDYLDLGFTYYYQRTTQALLPEYVSPSTGPSTTLLNAGAITNTGTELRLRLQLARTDDFRLAIHGSWVRNQNCLEEAPDNTAYLLGGLSAVGAYAEVGQSLAYLRGSIPTFNATGELTAAQADQFLGNINPAGYGMLGLDASWRRWSFFVHGDYQYGAYGVAVNDILRFTQGNYDDPERVPEASQDPALLSQLSQRWVEAADFCKIRQIGLNYRVAFPQKSIRALTLGVMYRNPILWTASGFDPEVYNLGTDRQYGLGLRGFGLGAASTPRQLRFTAEISF